MIKLKCKFCNKEATRYHANHKNRKLELLCEEHYSEWHPEFVVLEEGGSL